MFGIFLADMNGEHVAELITVDDRRDATELCVALQPHLKDGIEAHFVSDDEYPDDEAEVERKYAAYLERERAERG